MRVHMYTHKTQHVCTTLDTYLVRYPRWYLLKHVPGTYQVWFTVDRRSTMPNHWDVKTVECDKNKSSRSSQYYKASEPTSIPGNKQAAAAPRQKTRRTSCSPLVLYKYHTGINIIRWSSGRRKKGKISQAINTRWRMNIISCLVHSKSNWTSENGQRSKSNMMCCRSTFDRTFETVTTAD